MKYLRIVSLVVLCAAVVFSLAAVAQDQGAPGGQPQARRGPMSAQDRLDMMSKELNLTDDQKAKIKPILDNEQKQVQDLRADTSLSREDMMTKRRDIMKKTNDDIKAVLNDDQKKKFDEMMQRRRGPGGPPGGGPGGPGGPPGF